MLILIRNTGIRLTRIPFPSKLLVQSSSVAVSRHLSSLPHQNGLNHPQRKVRNQLISTYRSYSSENDSKSGSSIPRLTKNQIKFVPPAFSFIRWNFAAWKIRSSLDPEFTLSEFVEGSKQAVQIISDKMANADFDGLRDLVEDDVIDELKEPIESMTTEQRSNLRIASEDIARQFISDINFIYKEERTFVEIAMVYHVVHGLGKLASDKITPSLSDSSQLLDENFVVANYRFTKEFTKGVSDDWIVTYVDQINISDEMKAMTKEIEKMMKRFSDKDNEKKK